MTEQISVWIKKQKDKVKLVRSLGIDIMNRYFVLPNVCLIILSLYFICNKIFHNKPFYLTWFLFFMLGLSLHNCDMMMWCKWMDPLPPAKWAPCNKHNEGRRADGSLCHSTAGHLSQRSPWCSALSCKPDTQSVLGATPHPVLWSSGQQKERMNGGERFLKKRTYKKIK